MSSPLLEAKVQQGVPYRFKSPMHVKKAAVIDGQPRSVLLPSSPQ